MTLVLDLRGLWPNQDMNFGYLHPRGIHPEERVEATSLWKEVEVGRATPVSISVPALWTLPAVNYTSFGSYRV